MTGPQATALPSSNTVARKINRERIVVLGWGRAILLQLAHPLVAQGVADHTRFGQHPAEYFRRAWRTIGAMLNLTFGTEEEARATADRINKLHVPVNGAIPRDLGSHAAGTPYSARDPELLRWVHATLIDSLPLAYETFVGPLADWEKDAYCREAGSAAALLGLPSDAAPQTMGELESYMADMFARGEIEVTEPARALAHVLLHPHLGPASPLFGIARFVTTGLLPAAIRDQYGFSWSPRRERSFRALTAGTRQTHRMLPAVAREWPVARASEWEYSRSRVTTA